jgi:pSer/pThr/pTyr-binding forkhead associated (FHA) protein
MNVPAIKIEPLPKNEPNIRVGGTPSTVEERKVPNNVKPINTKRLPEFEARLECLTQPGFAFKVYDQGILGRQGDIDVSCLENCLYISRIHAKFIYAEGKWHLQNLTSTNNTMVNNTRVPQGSRRLLSDGDRITTANISFLFRTMTV